MVELVVVIGVVMVLLGFLLPALSGARGAAELTNQAMRIRQLGIEIEVYVSNNDSSYPYSDGATIGELLGELPQMIDTPELWYGDSEDKRIPGIARPTLSYTIGFCYDWRQMTRGSTVYSPDDISEGATDFSILPSKRVRSSEVTSPSLKGLGYYDPVIWGSEQGHYCCIDIAPGAPICFGDNSVSVHRWYDLLPQTDGVLIMENGVGVPVITTWNGAKGRDR
jgi:type II secretory pathway pseudopilin PulG